MSSDSNNSVPLFREVFAHLVIPVIFDLLLECLDCGPKILLTLALDLLNKHLRAHVVEPLGELSLDLLAEELDVLQEGVLSVALGEPFVALILLQAVTHVLPLRERRYQVPGFVQKVAERLQTGGKQGF